MLLYADCANIERLIEMDTLGIMSGITTNPAILAKESGEAADTIAAICRVFPDYPVFAQVNARLCDEMVSMALNYASISPKVVIKIPACLEGFKAMNRIRKESLFLNEICITTVTTAAEALLAVTAGAEYVAPYVGDIDQIGYSGMETLKTIIEVAKGTSTKVLAAATERAQDMTTAAVLGADIATITPNAASAVLEKPYPITEWYLKLFQEAAQNKEALDE